MASNLEFVKYVCEQLEQAGEISYKMMFGEYGIYCNGKFVALICDNQFLVKKTKAGEELLPNGIEVPPYEGAKPCFLIEELEDKEFLSELIKKTWEELPMPKPKTPKKKKTAK